MGDSPTLPRLRLLAGRDRRIAGGRPWAFSNEIRMDTEAKALPPGGLAALLRTDGKPLGVGTFNPHSLIAFRLFARDARAVVDGTFLRERLAAALGLRERLFAEPFYRLVHAEGDGLPGLIVDRFGDVLTIQAATAGMDRLLPEVLDALDGLLAPRAMVLRNDSRGRALEGLPRETHLAKGALAGPVELRENGCRFLADVLAGQKTGWFFDQRANRAFAARLAHGGRMLDLFCYAGGFALAAARAGATAALGIDGSQGAVDLANRSAALNGLGAVATFRRADAFDEMARLDEAGERFRLVVADPPAFVPAKKNLKQGLRAYRKMARMAACLVEPGGFLLAGSCSHNVDAEAFRQEVAAGLAQAGRTGRILRAGGAAADHPIHPQLPETAYLKTLTLHLD